MDRQIPSAVAKEHRQMQNVNHQKKNFKLLVDPQLKKGQEKLVRFDGELYSCVNHGQGPVVVRDPRAHTTRLWARRLKAELPVPRYKVDEWYVGAVPPREVTFSKLNDNTTKQFMEQLCAKYGKLERVRVYHHPKSGKHMGLAKVVFSSIKSAAICIERLHQTSIMGNVINAELDCKGELLKKLHHKIIRGEMVADTMPDVIKHTQEKPKVRPHKIHASRRKSSTDDPRRKSMEALERRRSTEQSSASGPKTPPVDIKPAQVIERADVRVPPVPHVALHSSHDNHGSHHSPHFHKGPGLSEMPNPHSLESGYGSHPGSASLISDQTSPFGVPVSNPQEGTPEVHNEATLREQKDKLKKYDPTHKVKTTPVWTDDLVHRIESLLNEQNEKYNLGALKSKLSESDKSEDSNGTPQHEQEEENEEIPTFNEVKREKTQEDLEDGECSGEDGTEEGPPELNEPTPISSDEMETEKTLSKNPPSPNEEISETSRQRFSRSPSPSYHYPPKRSPPKVLERHAFEGRHNRFSPPPEEFFHHRMRHPSPGRPPVDFNDRNYRVYGARPHSPPFGLHRRHSPPPFDGHRRISRSPGFDHHRHHYSPPRRRPMSPGFMRHHEMRPGHPEYLRRRSPSPIFSHHRRSPSPGPKFSGPLLRREFDYSPRRERMYYSPREMERHHGGFSPRHLEHERHHKRSPGGHRSPDPGKLREHRELPPEFRDRWLHHRSPSPHQQRSYNNAMRPHKHSHRSRSSSPENLQNTPPRIRSPVRMRPDQRPYSPGDLPVGDSVSSQGALPHAVSSESDSVEAGAIIPSKRKERESSDDVPLISLDERLREITGEAPPEQASPIESPKPTEEAPEPSQHVSPTASEDMEISSGGGGSEHGDQAPPFKQHPHPDMGIRNANFRPVFPGPHGQPWRANGPGPHMMWNEYNPRFQVNQHRPMWREHGNSYMRFPPNMHNGYPQPMMNHPQMGRGGFNNQMLPPPPPGWNRPWVQDQPHQMNSFEGFDVEDKETKMEESACDSTDVLSDRVLRKITADLKDIIKRDLNKKVIETMAFKVYESWWDKEHALKNPKPTIPKQPIAPVTIKTEVDPDQNKDIKPDPEAKSVHEKMPALLNTFDPLNWAKGSLEMDGFRIGLGFRSAISKMPSFRVKKRTPSPIEDKRTKLEAIYRKNKTEKEKPDAPRKRIWLDSEGEEEDESEQESSEEEEEQRDAKSRVLHVEDVFSSSSSEEEDSDKSSGEEESEEESEEEQDMEEEHLGVSNKRSLSLDEQIGPPKKRHKLDARSDSDSIEGTIKIDERISEAAASLSELQSGEKFNSASMLSPPAGSNNLSEKDLRRIHPKKRYRVLSKDETHNLDLIAEVSNRLRSDDELSLMSDKEKAALEVLQEMKSTPERRVSSTNRSVSLETCLRSFEQSIRLSESSDSMDIPQHPITPGRQLNEGVFSPDLDRRSTSLDSALPDSNLASGGRANSTVLPPLFNEGKQSGDDELEAVEALLSIKKSQPPIPPLSPQPSLRNQQQDAQRGVKTKQPQYDLSQKDRAAMEALAEEHNYFATKHREARLPEIDPIVLRILEEHSYSCPPSEKPKPSRDGDRYKRNAESFYDFPSPGEPLSASTAERVKLRRTSKSKRVVPDDVTMRERKARPTYARHKRRTKEEEMRLLYLMWATGLDLEDMRYLRYEYEQMLAQAHVPQWANDTHWAAHPITNIPDPDTSPTKRSRRKRSKKVEQNAPKVHETGCSRSEGYYKVADKTKLIQRRLMYRQADNTEPPATSKVGKSAASSSGNNTGNENSRETRHMMRRIASEFGSDASDLLKYNQLMFRKKSVKFKRSRIHGWGLFAQETIGADEMVIEYVGQLVRSLVADRREVDYTKRGIGSSYLFRIDSDHIIDATKCGNYARFMNHSCDPSCYAKIITVEGSKKIVIYSKNVIKPSEEITYDYKFPIEDDKIPCFCGAINCRGTLN